MMESESGNIDWEGRDEKMFFEKKEAIYDNGGQKQRLQTLCVCLTHDIS